ncbi:hypothetical protein [Tsukamurella sp. USMM236]|uniref:hypothetical protein n=1 Tax=Tsukamurella sp. USMM236 TaxID=3081301 RepID=UPI003016CC40
MVAAERAVELGNAIRACHAAGGSVFMVTLTMRHRREDALGQLWDGLSSGWRAAFGGVAWTGKAGTTDRPRRLGQRELFDVAGHTRTVEVTVGVDGAGWHVHVHALIFVGDVGLEGALVRSWGDIIRRMLGWKEARDVPAAWVARIAFASLIYRRWRAGLGKAGFDCGAAGVDVREVADHGGEFIGRYLAKATYDAATAAGYENAGGTTKRARGRNQTPFEVLYEISESVAARSWGIRTPRRWKILRDSTDFLLVDLTTAEVKEVAPPLLWRRWWEWEQESKGRRQLVWARSRSGHRADLWDEILQARGRERGDEEIARDDLGGVVLGEISRSSWYGRMAYRPSWLTAALEAAERGPRDLRDWCADHDIEFDPVPSRIED